MIRERKHRLPLAQYRGTVVVSFTARLRNHASHFTDSSAVKPVELILLSCLPTYACESEVYLFMPDHLHLILRGTSDRSDVYKAMRMFKQRSGFWFGRQNRPTRWQKDFYDHILQTQAELERHVRYILSNPVVQGLVTSWKDYPFKGSTMHSLDDWEI